MDTLSMDDTMVLVDLQWKGTSLSLIKHYFTPSHLILKVPLASRASLFEGDPLFSIFSKVQTVGKR